MKKTLFCLIILAITAGSVWGQVTHNNDDRDLFIGVPDTSNVKSNIMLLADTSGSMNTAIYPMNYHANLGPSYRKDAQGDDLTLVETLPEMTNWSTNDSSIRYLSATTQFKICRGVASISYTWDARGTYDSRLNGPLRWKVYKDTLLTPGGAQYVPLANQIVDYRVVNNVIGAKARIINVTEGRDNGGARRRYWLLEMDLFTNVGPPPPNGNPPNSNTTIYFNFRQQIGLDEHTAWLIPATESCVGALETYDAALYGGSEDGNQIRYDETYLYWLAFHASAADIAMVRTWATTGTFLDAGGISYNAGYFRMQVLRDVMKDVAADNYQAVKLGLASFDAVNGDDGQPGNGAIINEELNNVANLGNFQLKIDTLRGNTNTPLAEAMADVWQYYKGIHTYYPNTGNIPSKIPMDSPCQNNYIILMTDGQSTRDRFIADSKYTASIFHDNPVQRTGLAGDTGWGDFDAHDPVSGVQPTDIIDVDGNAYCPGNTCWIAGSGGTDYLDDVAYYLAHSDLFPDEVYAVTDPLAHPYMPGLQTIQTYTIGFNVDNDILAETAENGNGVYYQATSYDSLKTALTNAIVNIKLRDMAFAAFTAPKKITSTVGEGFSFVGYFMPSALSAIWEGHLQSFRMTDSWFADLDGNGLLENPNGDGDNEKTNPFNYQSQCQLATGKPCLRVVDLDKDPVWDTALKITDQAQRNLYTYDSDTNTYIPFTAASASLLMTPMGAADTTQAEAIIAKIGSKYLGDVFHSDIAYVGAPLAGKKFVKNLNPVECTGPDKALDADCFEKLLADKANRAKVLYVGSNDGILHQINATNDSSLGGTENWGFIPDEVLPKLKTIALDNTYAFTIDGRLIADDIYYRGTTNDWRTILVFGLKDGGHSFYALNITETGSQPQVMWKFKDDTYSGKSWSKPFIGKIREIQPDNSVIDRWVVIVAGGMAFNNLDADENEGKAVFVIDASSGELIWMIGYNQNGAADNSATANIETVLDSGYTGPGVRYLTNKSDFNYPIPSAITPVDRDNDGFLDTIYFGNVAGNLFKTNIASADAADWKTYQLFKKDNSIPQATSAIDAIAGSVITVATPDGFDLHDNVFQPATGAMGTIDGVERQGNTTYLTVNTISPASFSATAGAIVVPSFDPIFLSPTIFFDPCSNLWVAFGTGDRIRSRTNPDTGKFLALRDGSTVVSSVNVQKTDIVLSDLVPLTFTEHTATNTWTMAETDIKVADKWGWQFTFPMSANHEKLFDPEPLVLPDLKMIPHIFFNTYQPSPEQTSEDCDAPDNGLMYFYNLKCDYCGTGTMAGDVESGRIAGGGVFQGTDYILYEGKGEVASIPPLQDIKPIKLIFTGNLLFMKEKKR